MNYPLGIRQRCCLPTEPIAGELLDASSIDEALSLIAREAMFRHACAMGLEGIVPKRATSRLAKGQEPAHRAGVDRP